MGQCICCKRESEDQRFRHRNSGGAQNQQNPTTSNTTTTTSSGVIGGQQQQGSETFIIRDASGNAVVIRSTSGLHNNAGGQRSGRTNLGSDIKDLIMETLTVIRTLVNNEQEPPAAMLKLNIIADKSQGWLLIVQTMVDVVPADNPLGPAVITLFLDESPLPTKETVMKLLFYFNLSSDLASSTKKQPIWHRNVCIVLGCIAEKLAGPNSVATFKTETLDYLITNLSSDRDPNVILFSLIALEKYAQTSENKSTIIRRLNALNENPLERLEKWFPNDECVKHQCGFCAQWALDNLFVKNDRAFTYETIDTKNINVMLNHNDVSEYLKISPEGLEARCDVSSFESVRCTFQAMQGVWYYEAIIVTSGVMQIGWATKNSKFLNHEGYGIGDDEFSVAYDGCRQLIWHNAASHPHQHAPWRSGDVLGCLLDLNQCLAVFYLNGTPLSQPHTEMFDNAKHGFFAAASFMSFQQCRFNFGNHPFRYPPPVHFQTFNDHASLSDEQRVILPRHKKLELLRQSSTQEGACSLCFNDPGVITFKPCNHNGFCNTCAAVLEQCPLCRGHIEERVETFISLESIEFR